MNMQTLIQPEVKLKIIILEKPICQAKQKSTKSRFSLNFKFYQKLFAISLVSCAFLIFPESPKDSAVLCEKNFSPEACSIW